MTIVVDVDEAVPQQAIEQLAMPQAIAIAGLVEEVGRLRHIFHTTGDDDVGITAHDRLGSEHRRFQT
jgi:predicted Zn-dependent protease with MMP-like domain